MPKPKILKASEQGIDGRLEALWHELGGEDQGRHGRKHAYGRSNHGIAKHVEDLVADAKRYIDLFSCTNVFAEEGSGQYS